MTSPFERFTRPSDAFEQDATKLHNLAHTMAEEDAELTIAFMLAGIIVIAIAKGYSPEILVREFKRAIASFRSELNSANTLHGNSTEH